MNNPCDICLAYVGDDLPKPAKESFIKPAVYDGKTKYGPWAYMCEEHFKSHGIGLGIGKGSKLED